MRFVRVGLFAIALAAYLAGCGGGISSGDVLVEVNGDKITEGDLKFLGEINPRIERQLQTPQGKKRILENLVEQNLLYQQAIKQGINRDAKVKAKAELYRRVIIAQALIDEEIQKAAKKYYEENQDNFKKLKLSDILIKFDDGSKKGKRGKKDKARSEEEALKLAQEVRKKIQGGASFEEMAKEYSEDTMTKMRGGNLGVVSKDDKRLVSRGLGPVLDKAFTMKVGEVSEPLKTAKGYYLVTVTRGIELEPFDEAEGSILFKVRGDVKKELLAKLTEDAKIVYPAEEERKKEIEKKIKEAKEAKAKAEKKGQAEAEKKDEAKDKPEELKKTKVKRAPKPEEQKALEAKE